MRKLPVFLMLGCAAAQLALGSSLVGSAIRDGIHQNDHAHSAVLRSDGNHLDVVLSHGERDAHDHDGATHDHDHAADVSEDHHVVHITKGDVVNTTPRRAVLGATLVVANSSALLAEPASVRSPLRSLALRAGGIDHLRTIVLRL